MGQNWIWLAQDRVQWWAFVNMGSIKQDVFDKLSDNQLFT
jgi:hypothetical protein